jgi:hypothetical protein
LTGGNTNRETSCLLCLRLRQSINRTLRGPWCGLFFKLRSTSPKDPLTTGARNIIEYYLGLYYYTVYLEATYTIKGGASLTTPSALNTTITPKLVHSRLVSLYSLVDQSQLTDTTKGHNFNLHFNSKAGELVIFFCSKSRQRVLPSILTE